jgi:hypothetical protein
MKKRPWIVKTKTIGQPRFEPFTSFLPCFTSKPFYHSVGVYQITLHNVAGRVDLLVEFRREEDGVKVAGEAPEDDGGAEDPETKQDAARGP